MNLPFFSIIIPCFNSSKTVCQAISSVLIQDYSNFEIIIIDGKSSDDTISILNRYNDFRIRIYSEPDQGIYDAMNKGLKLAQGNWLYFLGSDDYLYDNLVLRDIHSFISFVNFKVIYGNVKLKGNTVWASDNEVYGSEFNFNSFYKNNICHQSIFYNREFILKHNFTFDLRFPISSDWDFNFKCLQKTKFYYVPRIISVFHSGGISSNQNIIEPFHIERRKYLPLRVKCTERLKKIFTIFFSHHTG